MLRTRTALLAQTALAGLALAASSTAAATTTPKTTTIASATSLDYRVVLGVRKNPGGNAPTAEVIVTTYVRSNSRWHHAGSRNLPGTYFWKTVSAPHSLCRLEIDSTSSTGARGPRAIVQLLVSPSIGCGRTQTISLPK